MADKLVLDASAGVEILDRSFTGRRLAKDMETAEVWTVEHFGVEVAKVLRRDVLSGELSDEEATRRVAKLVGTWEVNFVRVAPLLSAAWALRHNVTVHDALYVVLARQLGATLVTGDRKLAQAPGVDVPIRTI